MPNVFIELELEEVRLTTYSEFEKEDDIPIDRRRFILFEGKPVYSSTYTFPEIINFNSGGERIALPKLISVRITEHSGTAENIGHLTYIEHYSDSELGINEPDQFAATVPYPTKEFDEAWNLVGIFGFGQLKVSVSIDAPKTDISGYESIIDIQDSKSWPLSSFNLSRYEKRT